MDFGHLEYPMLSQEYLSLSTVRMDIRTIYYEDIRSLKCIVYSNRGDCADVIR